jgi:hypothetical protein
MADEKDEAARQPLRQPRPRLSSSSKKSLTMVTVVPTAALGKLRWPT